MLRISSDRPALRRRWSTPAKPRGALPGGTNRKRNARANAPISASSPVVVACPHRADRSQVGSRAFADYLCCIASFTIIVPTTGRSTLPRTLHSIATQLQPGDELIVACNDDGNYGDRSIDRAQGKASGDYVLFCDDDDIYTAGALQRMRTWADANPGKIGLFRRGFNTGAKQWRKPVLSPGNIQRMCLCIPNVPGAMPTWTGYKTEVDMPIQAAQLQGAEIVFVDDVIGLARPERNPWRKLRYTLRLRSRLRILRGEDERDVLVA